MEVSNLLPLLAMGPGTWTLRAELAAAMFLDCSTCYERVLGPATGVWSGCGFFAWAAWLSSSHCQHFSARTQRKYVDDMLLIANLMDRTS
eukprot:155687-Amphidinium_carterae.2